MTDSHIILNWEFIIKIGQKLSNFGTHRGHKTIKRRLWEKSIPLKKNQAK